MLPKYTKKLGLQINRYSEDFEFSIVPNDDNNKNLTETMAQLQMSNDSLSDRDYFSDSENSCSEN